MRRLTFYEIGFSAFFPRTFHNGRTKRFQTASSRGNILGKTDITNPALTLGKSGTDKETMAHAFGRRGRYRSR